MAVFEALSIGASIFGGFSKAQAKRKAIKAQNKANEKAWKISAEALRGDISTAYNRISETREDITASRIDQKVALRMAAGKAEGERNVQAAQMGIQGRRASRDVAKDIRQTEANQISDIEFNSVVQLRNTVRAFNDTAKQAVTALNNSAPIKQDVPSVLSSVIGGISAGLSAYSGMNANAKTDFKNIFNFKGSAGPTTIKATQFKKPVGLGALHDEY